MKTYTLYYSTYDYSESGVFIHEKDKSKEQFDADCKRAMIECGETYLSTETSWADTDGWFGATINKLIEYGYKHPENYCFNIPYTGIIEDDDDKKEFIEPFQKIVGKKLLQKAIKHNKDLQKRLNKEGEE